MFDDMLLRRVILKLRSTVNLDADDYWTMDVFLLDEQGEEENVPGVKEQTITKDFPANINIGAYQGSEGLRVQANHEVIVRFSSTGSPADLTQVQLYADWFVGI